MNKEKNAKRITKQDLHAEVVSLQIEVAQNRKHLEILQSHVNGLHLFDAERFIEKISSLERSVDQLMVIAVKHKEEISQIKPNSQSPQPPSPRTKTI